MFVSSDDYIHPAFQVCLFNFVAYGSWCKFSTFLWTVFFKTFILISSLDVWFDPVVTGWNYVLIVSLANRWMRYLRKEIWISLQQPAGAILRSDTIFQSRNDLMILLIENLQSVVWPYWKYSSKYRSSISSSSRGCLPRSDALRMEMNRLDVLVKWIFPSVDTSDCVVTVGLRECGLIMDKDLHSVER